MPSIHLEGSLLIQDVEAGRERLLGAFSSEGPITIDLSGLVTVDSAGIQLLLAARHEAGNLGRTLEFTGATSRFDDAVGLLGLCEALFGALRHEP